MALKSTLELYTDFLTELQARDTTLTDTNEGSIIDILGGVVAQGVNEVNRITVDEFAKTFFSTAHGPEITGGPDDLQTLAVDHFGSNFSRPGAVVAMGTVTFSRPNTDAGNVAIPVGTIVKTGANANGVSQRFRVVAAVTLSGLSINASIEALVPGTEGNVLPDTITEIESTLTDSSVIVTNDDDMAGGKAAENDAEYRETIRALLETLRGATKSAIEAKAKSVPGVENATAVEFLQFVKEWNIGSSVTVGDYFGIPRVKLYVADANGTASDALVDAVDAAVRTTRAAGVRVEIIAATALEQDWTANITLNPSGPNFATFQSDPQKIIDTMTTYMQNLAIGTDFSRSAANASIMAIWGPAGTNDLTAFATTVPSGDVSVTDSEKLIPGTVGIG